LSNPNETGGRSAHVPVSLHAPKIAVLAVDDHPGNLVALDALLNEAGFDVVLANSGSDALRRLSEGSFGCVLLDVRMPGIDGFETAALIRKREQWKDLPIIFMTSTEPTLLDYSQGYSLGAVDFVTRPLASEILKGKVRAVTQLHLDRELARRERDEALKGNQHQLRLLLASLPIAVWFTDANLVITYCTGALYGQGDVPPPESFIGKPLPDILKPQASGEMHPALSAHHQALKGQSVTYEDETTGRTYEGHVRPLKDGSGRICGVAGAAIDISERKAKEEEARLATAKVHALNQDLEAFVQSVSHDLRTPLRGMSGMAEILLEHYDGKVLDAEGRAFVGQIVAGCRRLDQMTMDLLEYSRMARAEAPPEVIDLIPILKEALAGMNGLLATRKARVEWANLSEPVLGSPLMVQQVFQNLIDNATKFVGAGVEPRIRIRGEAGAQVFRVWVEDNGIGITPEGCGRVFRLFERLNSQKEYPGTGVGLALVKRAIERMGGRVGVESVAGQGSSFWFELRRS
jgi:signal transduction histidine kinase/FixJ family two-component response regulator